MLGFAPFLNEDPSLFIYSFLKKAFSFKYSKSLRKNHWRERESYRLKRFNCHLDQHYLQDVMVTSTSLRDTESSVVRILKANVLSRSGSGKETWIEIENSSDTEINLHGWRIVDENENTRVINNLMVESGKTLVLPNIRPLTPNRKLRLFSKNSVLVHEFSLIS